MEKEFGLPTGSLVKMMLACGMIQIAAYYFAGSMASPSAHLAIPQPDTLLYCQSARQIAEGAPFVFTPGNTPSTGNTTHLYPFLLSALYQAGATGDALVTAGFVLNALFYLIFLANWGAAVGRLATSSWVKGAACALLAVDGHSAYGALSQSDTGLFMAVSSGLLASLLAGRTGWFAALLVLAPWCRPEGAVLSFLFAGALLVRRFVLRQKVSRVEWATAVLGCVSGVGIFAFNLWLTGYAQFQSVYYKGYSKHYDFLAAVNLSVNDAVRMGRELFLGLPDSMPRQAFFIPLLGAVFAWLGLMKRPWQKAEIVWKEIWWLAACALSVMVVASSGWQNTNMDRYLVWLLPIWLVYIGEGAVWVGQRFPRCEFRALPFLAVFLFHAAGSLWLVTTFYSACVTSQQQYDFTKDAQALLPKGARVGGPSVTLAYALPGHTHVHLMGIYTPELLTRDPLFTLERMKHEPTWRFDFWTLPSEQAALGGTKIDALCGPITSLCLDGSNLRRASWECLDRALMPVSDAVLAQTAGWRLADSLDVGYAKDEKRCDYATFSRFHLSRYELLGVAGTVGTNQLFEIGRVIVGSDSMTVRLKPGRPVKVVLRTLGKAETDISTAAVSRRQAFTFDSPLKLAVHVEGKAVGIFELPMSSSEKELSEVAFTLPAEAITQASMRLTLYGDHVALGYWFYQPAE